jgi:hypothetical protein
MLLTWTEQAGAWQADGFRIELAAPLRWLLLDNDREIRSVGLEEAPLAVARTLSECKREAELLAAARQRSDLRRKHMVLLLLMLASLPMLLGPSFTQNALLVLIVATVAARSLGVITGTILWRWSHPDLDVFYQ